MIISIWARHEGKDILGGFIEAFIISVTIIVVAIPEGLPLAVTIALAYSTKKMYQDQCFIRVLSACETMGNATNICSDKTGTLTENRMTVVEGYFAGIKYSQIDFISLASTASSSAASAASSSAASAPVSAPASGSIAKKCKDLIAENACINRIAYLVYKDANGKELDKPNVIGSKTEGALIMMCKSWGYDDNHLKTQLFKEDRDKLFAFNSLKKRSTAIYHQPEENRTRLLCKGASEWVIKDCTHYLTADGSIAPLTSSKLQELNEHIINMANNALRTLCLAHRDFSPNTNPLPEDWKENPPDGAGLCLDCIVGIIDPLRPDVIEAVRIAQGAGVTVRMVTGDNLNTACAIARQCGILTDEGQAIEGPVFRQMTPAAVDEILPNLQVVARSSPEDKYLLVTRLNGYAIPDGKEEWEEKHKGKIDVAWETHKDLLLPGYKEEWLSTRPYGGQVVGVTGDGTNDAPALKAADVGLAMGIAGTKVAQSASDIVILDDKFSSIVKAIMWGRSVYDNIRKFLQFQLTVNVVALVTVFIGACAGFPPPLNAVMMLWINLIMDTLGALALATEGPTMKVLERKPYKRNAFLVSRPMMRNIIVQSALQLILIFVILFGHKWFNVEPGERCAKLDVKRDTSPHWITGSDRFYSDDHIELALLAHPEALPLSCSSLISVCKDHHSQDSEGDITQTCYEDHHTLSPGEGVTFNDLRKFSERCIDGCQEFSWVHGSLIFNTFVFAQIFNEYNAKSIHSEWDIFTGFFENHVHLLITFITLGLQVMLIEVAGPFMKTSPLTINQWLISLGLGALAVPVGILMRFIPCEEDPETFFDNTQEIHKAEVMMKTKKQNLEIA
jgi:P-type Ca2+ transporter type 2C